MSGTVDDKKQKLSRAEEFFAKNEQFLGHIYAASGLRQAFLPSGPSYSYDWALINVDKSRLCTNKEIGPPAPQSLEPSATLFMVGRSTGFTMDLYGGTAETTIKSRKADQGGALHMVATKEPTVIPIQGVHYRFSNLFGRAGDSGAAVIDRYGLFVGLYFAGNDYTGTGYFVKADNLFCRHQAHHQGIGC